MLVIQCYSLEVQQTTQHGKITKAAMILNICSDNHAVFPHMATIFKSKKSLYIVIDNLHYNVVSGSCNCNLAQWQIQEYVMRGAIMPTWKTDHLFSHHYKFPISTLIQLRMCIIHISFLISAHHSIPTPFATVSETKHVYITK
jgi:hypothetical protein